MPTMSAEEAKWRAEDDARILADANVIKNDPGRLAKAKDAAARIVEEQSEKTKAMRTVAGRNSTPSDQRSQQRRTNYNVFQKIGE